MPLQPNFEIYVWSLIYSDRLISVSIAIEIRSSVKGQGKKSVLYEASSETEIETGFPTPLWSRDYRRCFPRRYVLDEYLLRFQDALLYFLVFIPFLEGLNILMAPEVQFGVLYEFLNLRFFFYL